MHGIRIGSFDATGILNNLDRFSRQFSLSIRKISSGDSQIASEEPAMISFSEKIRSKITENTMMMKNIRDRMGMLETARSGMLLKVDVMQRIRELAVQYNNDTLSDSDKEQIQNQVNELSKILNGGDEERFSNYKTTLQVGNVLSLEVDPSQIIAEAHRDDGDFVIFRMAQPEESEYLLADIMVDNSKFMGDLDASEGPVEYVYQVGTVQEEEEEDSVPDYSYDLSKDGMIANIDKVLEEYSGEAVDISIKYKAMEYRLDQIMNENDVLKERLNNLTATDLAEETVNLMESKLMLDLGKEMLKLHQHIQKDMVTALLSAL